MFRKAVERTGIVDRIKNEYVGTGPKVGGDEQGPGEDEGTLFANYLLDPREVWARAYSQYMIYQDDSLTRNQQDDALDYLTEHNPHYQWPRDEFEKHVAPAIETVLKARGSIGPG